MSKAIVIEISGGLVTKITKLTDAPEKGILIVDHDNIYQSGDRESEVSDSLNIIREDETTTYQEFKENLYIQYGINKAN